MVRQKYNENNQYRYFKRMITENAFCCLYVGFSFKICLLDPLANQPLAERVNVMSSQDFWCLINTVLCIMHE